MQLDSSLTSAQNEGELLASRSCRLALAGGAPGVRRMVGENTDAGRWSKKKKLFHTYQTTWCHNPDPIIVLRRPKTPSVTAYQAPGRRVGRSTKMSHHPPGRSAHRSCALCLGTYLKQTETNNISMSCYMQATANSRQQTSLQCLLTNTELLRLTAETSHRAVSKK